MSYIIAIALVNGKTLHRKVFNVQVEEAFAEADYWAMELEEGHDIEVACRNVIPAQDKKGRA